MLKTNALLTILGLGVAACACAGGGQTEAEKARALILKTLQRTFSHNVVAIISQRDPENQSTFQSVHVSINKEGQVRQTVIYPLSQQGMELIDDGKLSAMFFPDRKVLVIQESSKLIPFETSRINLVVKNYGLTIGGNTTIAGQTATMVVAKPMNRDLETRRYYIDPNTGFILKLETVDSNGTPKLAFKAQQVSYPSRIGPSIFEIDQEGHDGRTVVYRRTISITSGRKDTPTLDFAPVLPQSNLPYGFDLQDAQINDTGQYRSVAVRISDGLVKGTVYQCSTTTAKRLRVMGGTSVGTYNGVRFVVAADVPESVRKKILDYFIEAARKGEDERMAVGPSTDTELSKCPQALSRAEIQLLEILLAIQTAYTPLEI